MVDNSLWQSFVILYVYCKSVRYTDHNNFEYDNQYLMRTDIATGCDSNQ